MPLLNTSDADMETIKIPGGGNFQFSAIRPEMLGATEYTLATIVIDVTGSVQSFAAALLDCLKTVVESLQKSPRAENLMLRIIVFNNEVIELHGFVPLKDIDLNSYSPFNPFGMTALFDATYSAIGAANKYGKTLVDQDFDVNACSYIITDGDDNASTVTPSAISKKINEGVQGEILESNQTILIGLIEKNDPSNVKPKLEKFKKDANLDAFIDAGEATPQKLAKLAGFVSQSISSQSQALGTGSASVPLVF